MVTLTRMHTPSVENSSRFTGMNIRATRVHIAGYEYIYSNSNIRECLFNCYPGLSYMKASKCAEPASLSLMPGILKTTVIVT